MAESIEQIVYDTGRGALADQESLVSGIRARTGTLLAAHALVASFLGATTIRAHGLVPLVWVALAALALGLVIAALILSPWRLRFSLDARDLFDDLQQAHPRNRPIEHGLASIGFVYQDLKEGNMSRVRRMSALSGTLAALMVLQTLAWIAILVVD